jgi:hypothetical protein
MAEWNGCPPEALRKLGVSYDMALTEVTEVTEEAPQFLCDLCGLCERLAV